MQDSIKIGTAALGGYVLGRTRKAKAAIGLALWLSGRGRMRDMARDQAIRLLTTDRGQDLQGELQGPVLGSGKQAALSLFETRAGRLSDALHARTERLRAATSAGRAVPGAEEAEAEGEEPEEYEYDDVAAEEKEESDGEEDPPADEYADEGAEDEGQPAGPPATRRRTAAALARSRRRTRSR